jgi:hypothetical protein
MQNREMNYSKELGQVFCVASQWAKDQFPLNVHVQIQFEDVFNIVEHN